MSSIKWQNGEKQRMQDAYQNNEEMHDEKSSIIQETVIEKLFTSMDKDQE